MSEVTRILQAIGDGQADFEADLLPAVYDELRSMASAKMVNERFGQTLDATGLVHEAYLRLVGSTNPGKTPSFDSRRHFFGAAAEAMRRILIDRARARQAAKRGGSIARVDIEPEGLARQLPADDQIAALNEALQKFSVVEPRKAELVRMRYFIGLTTREVAEILGISTATADRYWAYAKAWLQSELESTD